MSNIIFYLVIGLIVSLDAMALTIGKKSTYTDSLSALINWAGLNAAWHGGLLIFYTFFFHVLLEYSRELLHAIDFSWIRVNIPFFAEQIIWLIAKLKIHLLSIFAAVTIILVWITYSSKIVDRPLTPKAASLPRWMQPLFKRQPAGLVNNTFILNLQAAIVAVDMLALAALIKATDQTASHVDRIIMTGIVVASVFTLTLGTSLVARRKFVEKSMPPDGVGEAPSEHSRKFAKLWLMVTLRLVEPLLIFYFLLQLLAHMVVGIHIDSPALLLAAVLMVVAIIQMHGLARVVDAVRSDG